MLSIKPSRTIMVKGSGFGRMIELSHGRVSLLQNIRAAGSSRKESLRQPAHPVPDLRKEVHPLPNPIRLCGGNKKAGHPDVSGGPELSQCGPQIGLKSSNGGKLDQ